MSSLLARNAGQMKLSSCGAPTKFTARPRLVCARDGPRVVQGREYREDDNTLSMPGSGKEGKAPEGGPLYADEVKAAAPKPKSNLSKEMKDKLRAEYLGFGGAENTVARLARRPVIAAVTTVEAPAEASTSQPAGKSKWVIDENENLKSTMEHRLYTFGSIALMAATFYHGTVQADSLLDWLSICASLAAAYVLSDLGTGIYHWSVDNYGDGSTPFFGKQIAAFQGHHQRPWTITKREFCNNLHQVFKPFAYPAAFFLLISPWTPVWCDAFFSSFLFLVCMSQQFHAWSHMKKSELPDIVLKLQDANILISRKAHGAHHRPPFEGNYCIVSGWWNEPLDKSGFFRWLETVVLKVTGVEPRCWHEPEYEIEEEMLNATASV